MTRAEFLAMLDPPADAPSTPRLCVDVRFATGRHYLNVCGVTAAVEGDLCRDCRLPVRVWDKESLELAARTIRERLAFIFTELGIIAEDTNDAP